MLQQSKIKEIIAKLNSIGPWNTYLLEIREVDGKEKVRKLRPYIKNGELYVYLERCRKWIKPYRPSPDVKDLKIPIKKKTEEEKWYDSWVKVRDRLTASGLWQNDLKDINCVLEIGYENFMEFINKEMRNFSDLGDEFRCYNGPHTTIVQVMKYPARVKKMDFSEKVLESIRQHLERKEDCYEWERRKYDSSFRYIALHNVATYSEEYKDMGNGHYYIALDHTHALFIEDD